MRFRRDPVDSFWSKVDQSGGPDACWPWLAAQDPHGYGAVKWEGKKVNSHRKALELHLGRALLPNMDACHRCNNRICCNPQHLYEGTRKQNAKDALASGHFGAPFGQTNGRTKLDNGSVLEIYRRVWAGEGIDALAEEFGISHQTVSAIKHGVVWAWLTNHEA